MGFLYSPSTTKGGSTQHFTITLATHTKQDACWIGDWTWLCEKKSEMLTEQVHLDWLRAVLNLKEEGKSDWQCLKQTVPNSWASIIK